MPRTAGFSLIELLVAMVIGLVVTLAVTSVLIRSEGSKRSSTSVNEINQTGAYTAFVLDRVIRSAGSGFSQRWSEVYGCLLDVTKVVVPPATPPLPTGAVLPIPATIAASSAFRSLTASPLPIRLAPLIIGKDLANTTGTGGEVRGDVLLVMAGSAGVGESPQPVNPTGVTNSRVVLTNTVGYRTDDLVLLADTSIASCMMQQVKFTSDPPAGTVPPGSPSGPGGSTDGELPFGNPAASDGYYKAAGNTGVNLTTYGSTGSTVALQMGSATTNRPQFFAYAVGENRTLYSYDLLNPLPSGGVDNRPDTAIADNVVEMRAVYGLDTTSPPDGIIDEWRPATGNFAASALTNGTAASRSRLRQIIAVRVGLILRTSLQERSAATTASGPMAQETFQQPTTASLTLFEGLTDVNGGSLSYTRSVTGGDALYRYRPVDITIPLRNVQLAPQL